MLKFTKMTATGNDFIMIDNRKAAVKNRADFARKYCEPHFGIGADGVIFIESVQHPGSSIQHLDFRMRIFNPDGSEAEMCGNGARCAAVFARRQKIAKGNNFCFQTLAGAIKAEIRGSGARIGMVPPSGIELNKVIIAGGRKITLGSINTGVPHAVVLLRDIEKLDIAGVAPPIRHNRAFPKGTNVDFIKVLGRHRIRMRTFERGVEGETLACGTGAAASAVVSSLLGRTSPPVTVIAPGGSLKINFRRVNVPALRSLSAAGSTCQRVTDVTLEGEARAVYEGAIKNEK